MLPGETGESFPRGPAGSQLNLEGRSNAMAEIKWEKDFHTAVELAAKTHRPVFQDFWFDG
jgi:hypothetical protein